MPTRSTTPDRWADDGGTPQGRPAPADPQTGQDDVRWLTETQQRQWRAFRDGTALLFDVLARELDDGSGLSLGEYEVLVRLSEAPAHALRMSELADDLAHSRSRLTHTVARMERDGIVRREPARDDARGVNCVLTERGLQVLVAAAPGHVESVRAHLVDVLDDEQLAALGTAMQVVIEHLRAPAGDDDTTPTA
ncbi:MarR family winged helix-turn-helix transcriptional regulator [Cellulomonas xiejunii]|uniref:MarR family transcriptional regulator n=1 Tax=Cellulomonas xiejunii TaxID=2968083 RepID=A0ABY5KNY3_9CELL|nr:MarR family transcriptional regulator [Cellulomonas xiejunii]MCC2315412.1 MarR family transcriptional regulator [Cellulomonas xiejunii]MCC2320575.1 MarR family transcriptional regulator [Cellulomonas xiejunii]UUI70867.1 MarR family transcriptional regulator [Cellulomonas xiejunii]